MKICRLVYNTHLLLIVTNDLNKVTHDITEVGDTTKHNDYSNDSFHIAHGKVITITYSTECCKRIIAAYNELKLFVLGAQFVEFYEAILPFYINLRITEVPPEAADTVGDDDGNDDQSEYLINVQEHILRNNFLIS